MRCKVNFALAHLSYLAAKLLLLIFLNVFLKTKLVTQVFTHVELSNDLLSVIDICELRQLLCSLIRMNIL